MHLDLSPPDTDYDALHVGVPFDHNSSPLEHALIQQEQGKHKTTKKQSYLFFLLFFFYNKMKLKKKTNNKILKGLKKENSLEHVMRITSVQLLIKCTKAPSPTTTPLDSWCTKVVRNQQNL